MNNQHYLDWDGLVEYDKEIKKLILNPNNFTTISPETVNIPTDNNGYTTLTDNERTFSFLLNMYLGSTEVKISDIEFIKYNQSLFEITPSFNEELNSLTVNVNLINVGVSPILNPEQIILKVIGTKDTNTLSNNVVISFIPYVKQDYVTETFVTEKISEVIGAAPETLDTLEEIATKLSNNDDVVSALTTTIASKANSSDVYTKAEVDEQLANISSGGEIDLSGYAKTEDIPTSIPKENITGLFNN